MTTPSPWRLLCTSSSLIALSAFLLGYIALTSTRPALANDLSSLPPLALSVLAEESSAKAGRRMFNKNCSYCHGSKGKGGRTKKLQCRDNLDAATIHETVTNGRQSGAQIMPPWGDAFEEKERWEIVAYILSLRELPNCK